MKRNQKGILIFALIIMGAGCFALVHLRANQRLGNPGLRFEAIAGSQNVNILMPERVSRFTSQVVSNSAEAVAILPKDTSMMQRIYRNPEGFGLILNAVMMGTDRTSIHKPQFCLPGHGWKIVSEQLALPVTLKTEPEREMLVSKIIIRREETVEGRPQTISGVYLYWFVAENSLACGHWERIWLMSKHLMTTGTLDRWAYLSCFAVCPAGGEEKTQKQMFEFLSEAIPKLQTTLPEPRAEVSRPIAF